MLTDNEKKAISIVGELYRFLKTEARGRVNHDKIVVLYSSRARGYFFCVPKNLLYLVPDSWVRFQTLVTHDRFVTPELINVQGVPVDLDSWYCRKCQPESSIPGVPVENLKNCYCNLCKPEND